MAIGKKSVLLYCDLIHTIEKMDDKTAGEFFKHYLRYINDQEPETDNILVDITFESVKQNLKRDLRKWEKRAETSRENGKLGGRPPKVQKPKKPNGLLKNQTEPKEPVTVTVNDTVTDTVNENDNIINNNDFLNESLKSRQWIETAGMQNKVNEDVIKLYLTYFENHLITMEEQKNNSKEFKSHFINWMAKQDLSAHRKQRMGKSNQY